MKRFLFIFIRFKNGISIPVKQLILFLKWIWVSKETTNFTYDLTKANITYLSHFISTITKKPVTEIQKYIHEILNDNHLKKHIMDIQKHSKFKYKSDTKVRFGRRMGWYAVVRAMKPKVVIETGIDKGLGSCVIASALLKNDEEGFKGKYFGTDINPNAGYFFKEPYSHFGKILYGDSIESLTKLQVESIDLFINDSDHSDLYEANEYETILNKLTNNSIILGDNSHCTTKLEEFAVKNNYNFLFFKEEPKNHWYGGAGIGAAFRY